MTWVHGNLGNTVNFVRVNIRARGAGKVMKKYRIPFNSAYLIFDKDGKEVWRSYAMPVNGKKALKILKDLR